AINPVVKAPTLVCDDGAVLMDSSLILDYAESRVIPEKRLMPAAAGARRDALRLIGLALAGMEKCVQTFYELKRPEERVHAPWLERVIEQANAAFAELEREAASAKTWLQGEKLTAADVAVACAWRFSQHYTSKQVPSARFPALVAYSERAESLPEFASTPLD
ncbi:MAG: glutathione S-transferase family protein, partial [Bacillota bacterium]